MSGQSSQPIQRKKKITVKAAVATVLAGVLIFAPPEYWGDPSTLVRLAYLTPGLIVLVYAMSQTVLGLSVRVPDE